MSKLKSLKQKFIRTKSTEKHHLVLNHGHSSRAPSERDGLDENHVNLLTNWLEQLNRERLITRTDQNDIVIMPGGKHDQAQQIFINYNDIDSYMKTRGNQDLDPNEADMINMLDIARILLRFEYVQESSGQLSFMAHTIALDSNELQWLMSIIRDVRPNSETFETDIKLYDGESTQTLSVPYEHMTPTDDVRTVAIYLFQNGHIRYDAETGSYAYRYIEPDVLLDEKTKSPERIRQHHLLSYHIRQVYVDKQNKRVEVEFIHEPERYLVLPTHWYYRAEEHDFDRNYIIDILLANGGRVEHDKFIFNNETYSLREARNIRTTSARTQSTMMKILNLTPRQKHDLIRCYVDLVIENDGTKQDESNELVVLENPTDGHHLYFTPEHSQLIRQNQFQRQDVIHILVKNSQIRLDESGSWLLYYNKQHIKLPSSIIPSSSTITASEPSVSLQDISEAMAAVHDVQSDNFEQYHRIIDYMCRHGLITWDKKAKLIRLYFTDQILLLPMDHLRSILDLRIVSSAVAHDNVLPFRSRQLSHWLLNNSCMKLGSFRQ
ncbi:unnamed protein product [Adineta ricciae]|uniref:Uncharacterized protein n=1 Tax=Adineta ricciae TaxID=249248 RepID=A0A814EF40_ADIRI|nr:unnamed protein product [Adineta ricciae]CAF1336174.1 unnamed protein product [Adineta ricciae]